MGIKKSDDTVKIIPTDGVRYTVPQRINEIKETTVYFRVSDVFRDKKIVVSVDGEVLSSKKKQKLAPGEMETVKITAEMLEKAKGKTLEIGLAD